MVTSNPLLKREQTYADTGAGVMTLNGVIHKTGILFALCAASAYCGWTMPELRPFWMIALLAGFALSLVGIFMPRTTPFVAPVYALCEGLVLGGLSALINVRFPGVAATAVVATFSVLGLFLFLYATRIVQVTRGMIVAVVAATAGVAVVYLVNFVMGLFGHQLGFINGSGTLGIVVSVVICGIAAFNLFLDFAAIESQVRSGAPRYMEWYSGMALLITVVWLYLELLRLLSKLQRR